MKTLAFLSAFFLSLPLDVRAVPGPLMSGGVGLISAAGALFAMAAGVLALVFTSGWQHLKSAFLSRPKIFATGVSAFLAIAGGIAYWTFYGHASADPIVSLRQAIKSNPPSSVGSGDYAKMESSLVFSDSAGTGRESDYPELEKEIAYSVGRNRNVVWSRYLSDGKIRIDDRLLAEIERGAYSLPLSDLLNDIVGKKGEFRIVDLRTPEEFGTSAHFATAENVEYRKIMNGEVAFDPRKTYVFVCHDGTYDLSRSLVAAIYLRQNGIAAFALDTGVKPLLDAFSIKPVSFRFKPGYSVWSKGNPPVPGVVVDPLGALSRIPGVEEAGFNIRSFAFYRMGTPEYDARYAEISAVARGGGVSFACYDTFSCFYSRIFVDRLKSALPEADVTITVFR